MVHRFVYVYTCQNATLLEITGRSSIMTLAVGGTLKTNTTTTTNIFRISGGDIAALCIQVIRHKLCQYFDIVVCAQSRQMLNITNNLRMCGKLQQSYVLAHIYDV